MRRILWAQDAGQALDRLSPGEVDVPPSRRVWARVVKLRGNPAIELRDPNSGQDPDPATKPRHQYLVVRDRLWTRRLPPAPLDQPEDESPWLDTGPPRWETALLVADSPIVAWAQAQGLELMDMLASPTEPEQVQLERNLHGESDEYTAYVMPALYPWERWGDITSYPEAGHHVTCPVPGCGQELVWYEAGYVPGYRVCMTPLGEGRYDLDTLRHRFLLDHSGEYPHAVLVLDHD